MGFSILMYGMELMSGAVSPLADMPGFTNFLTAFPNPFLGVLVGAAFTGIIQSSAASVDVYKRQVLVGVQLVLVGQDLFLPAAVILDELGQSQLHACLLYTSLRGLALHQRPCDGLVGSDAGEHPPGGQR